MRVTMDLLVWRLSLQAAPKIPGLAEIDDWASILSSAEAATGGAFLDDVAAILRGFPVPRPARAADRAGSAGPLRTIDIVMADLRDLVANARLDSLRPSRQHHSGRPDAEAGIGPTEALPLPLVDPAAAATQLRDFLSAASFDPVEGAAAMSALASLRVMPAIDYRLLRQAPLNELAFAIGLVALSDFAARTCDLIEVPLGSAELLYRMARLDPQGLGAYASTAGRIARKSADILDLARTAAGPDNEAGFEGLVALLSRGCDDGLLTELIDDLGDADRSNILAVILDRMSRDTAGAGLSFIRRIRDAALDNLDWYLATRAQMEVARLRRVDINERVVLGAIQISSGDHDGALATLLDCKVRAPRNPYLLDLLAALDSGNVQNVTITRGYASPMDRQEKRLHRRGVTPAYAMRKGDRMLTVDVH